MYALVDEENEVNLKLLNLARSGNGVRRFHTLTNVITPETVGHHTAGVIGIIFCLYGQKPPLELVELALYHDSGEYITGDAPATAKWDFPAISEAMDASEAEVLGAVGWMPKFSEEHCHVLKFADLMDLCFKAQSEALCGNQEMKTVLNNGLQAAATLCDEKLADFPNARVFLSMFLKESSVVSE